MLPNRINTRQSSQPQTVLAPLGGLNGRDPEASLGATDAHIMDNVFPGTASVESRRGCVRHLSEALPGSVSNLAVYANAASDVMLAWVRGPFVGTTRLFDVSNPVYVEIDRITENLFNADQPITAMFSNAADNAQHLIVAGGRDFPYAYSGGAAITPLDITEPNINFVFAFKGRLYFGQKNKLGFHYLPPGAIQGDLSYFDLGQVSQLGGSLRAIASYSDDSGKSPNDYIVFITDKGELIVYAGFDPGNAASWELVGRYFTAEPIGQRCAINYGGDLLILTLEGAIAFSEIRRTGDAAAQGSPNAENVAVTSKLGTLLSTFNVNSDIPGWMGLQYANSGGWLLLNVPLGATNENMYFHYVMNTTTNSWCRFKNWNGTCFVVFNKRLYFGRVDGQVMLGDEGRFDDGEPIYCEVKQAGNYFEDGSGIGFLQKHFQWCDLLVSVDGKPQFNYTFCVDYKEEIPQFPPPATPPGGGASFWNLIFWDREYWSTDDETKRYKLTLNRGGVNGSLWLKFTLNGQAFRWFATHYVLEKTKGLLI